MSYHGYDREGLDAQYHMRGRHPEWQDFFEKWTAWSEELRARRPCRLNVPFGDGPDEVIDIFPAMELGAPVHAFIHGGYWQAMSKDEFSYVADGLWDPRVAVVVVNYALAPAVDIDEIVRQCRGALAWIWRNAQKFSGTRERIYVSGHSAGGHLTAMLLSTDWPAFAANLPSDLVKGGCAISGLYDLEAMRLCYVNDKLQLTEDQVQRQSPIYNVPEAAAPLILAVGGEETDEFHRQTRTYAELWRARGLALETMVLEGHNHYTIVDALGDPTSELTSAVRRQMGI